MTKIVVVFFFAFTELIVTENVKKYCKFEKFCENFIFANSVKRQIWDVKYCDYGMIYLYQ